MNYYRRPTYRDHVLPETPRTIFLSILALLSVLYLALTVATVRLAALEQEAREGANVLQGKVTILEEQYLALQEGVTRARASHAGLTDAGSRTVFASRDGVPVQTARLDIEPGIIGN